MRKMSHCTEQNTRNTTKLLHPPSSSFTLLQASLQNLLWYDVEWVMIFDCDLSLSVMGVFYYFSQTCWHRKMLVHSCVSIDSQWKFMSCVHKYLLQYMYPQTANHILYKDKTSICLCAVITRLDTEKHKRCPFFLFLSFYNQILLLHIPHK